MEGYVSVTDSEPLGKYFMQSEFNPANYFFCFSYMEGYVSVTDSEPLGKYFMQSEYSLCLFHLRLV
jgi:hypothetical protein